MAILLGQVAIDIADEDVDTFVKNAKLILATYEGLNAQLSRPAVIVFNAQVPVGQMDMRKKNIIAPAGSC